MHKEGSGGAYHAVRPSHRNDDDGDPAKFGLVERIKQIQRTSEEEKAKWWEFADTHGRGIRDPQRHDAPFLQSFLEHYDGMAEEHLYAQEVDGVVEEYAEEVDGVVEEYADEAYE